MDERKDIQEKQNIDNAIGSEDFVGSFISSLEEISPEESNAAKRGRKKKSAKRIVGTVFRVLLIVIFTGIFAVSGYMIVSNVIEGYISDEIYSEMNENFFEGVDRTGLLEYLAPAILDSTTPIYGSDRKPYMQNEYITIQTNNPFFIQFKEKLLQYQERNPDIYGWMQVEGTNISYACVKGEDNDFYLEHTATREFNVHGAIFADFRCSDDLVQNQNLVFYGHNSSYIGQMFHQLTKFLDKKFFDENKYVTIYTLSGVYKYEIFSIFETEATYKYCKLYFDSDEEFLDWCNEMKTKSIHKRDIPEFTPQTKILTMSTCTNTEDHLRYSVQARLISVEKYGE